MLTPAAFRQSLVVLRARDADLARVIAAHGPPPLWARDPGFPTLVFIILEQQVSLASARKAYERLAAVARPLTPRAFLALTPKALRRIGFSRQKAEYCRDLARAILAGRLRLNRLARLHDAAARKKLTQIKGIGPWTADIYLLMALRRPDVWPRHDLALAVAAQAVKGLERRPTPEDLEALGQSWRPWRSVAARILWHHYLSR